MSQYPYVLGNYLTLQLEDAARGNVSAKFTKLFEPFTISPVLQIYLDSPEHRLKGCMVLKLFDRRFGPNLRSEYKIPPWSSSIEQQYRAFVESGEIREFMAFLNDGDDSNDNQWIDPAKDEAFLYDLCHDMYKMEKKVYDRLKDVQGKHVPSLLACVRLGGCSPLPEPSNEFFDVPGIVLKYIDGFQPSNTANHIPKGLWQSIGDDAIKIVNLLGDRDILNQDVKARNFIVRKYPRRDNYQVFMIDFSFCDFRQPKQTDEEWGKAKRLQDEEGAVGAIMLDWFRGGFKYHRSKRYWSDRDTEYYKV